MSLRNARTTVTVLRGHVRKPLMPPIANVEVTCACCHTTFMTADPNGCCPIQRCGALLRYKPAVRR